MRTAVAAGAAAMLLVGCSTTVAGRAHAGGPQNFPSASPQASASPTPSKSPASSASGDITTGAELSSAINDASTATMSVRIGVTTHPAPGSGALPSSVTVDQKNSDGAVAAAQMQVDEAGVKLVFLFVSSGAYVKLPPSLATTASKPWFSLTAQSKNATVRTMAKSFGPNFKVTDIIGANASVATPDNAVSLALVGAETVTGVQTRHFHLVMDPNDVSAKDLKEVGVKTATDYTEDWWIDEQDRPIKSVFAVSGGGKKGSVTQAYSNYDVPLNLQPPPAAQIGG